MEGRYIRLYLGYQAYTKRTKLLTIQITIIELFNLKFSAEHYLENLSRDILLKVIIFLFKKLGYLCFKYTLVSPLQLNEMLRTKTS